MNKSLLVLLTGLLLLSACGSDKPLAADRPNVILITLDTVRYDYLSCYGYPEPTTPYMDQVATQGTRFDLAVSSAGVTPVSHAAILSGRFNRDHGLRVIGAGGGFHLREDVPTLATEFKKRGYRTIGVHSAFPVSSHFGLTRGFDVLESFSLDVSVEEASETNLFAIARRSDETIDLVLKELERAEDPFFLWLHLWDPHDPIDLPPEEFMPSRADFFGDGAGLENPQDEWRKAVYAAEITYQDTQFGRLLEYLEDSGRWDRTIMAITADHGEGLGEHGWAKHRILYQEQIHVPLIVRVPGVQQTAAVGSLVRTVDIAPTLLDYARVPLSGPMSGRSLRPLIEGGQDEPRLSFAEQINGYDFTANVSNRPHEDFSYCALDSEWKLIWRPNHPDKSELFRISTDPEEAENLFAWDHPQAVRLLKELANHASWVTEPFPEEGTADEATYAALGALGYAGGAELAERPQWEWVCPADPSMRLPENGPCPDCGSALVMIARGK